MIDNFSNNITQVKLKKGVLSRRLTKPCCIVVSAATVCKKYSDKSKLALLNIDTKTGKRVLKNQRQPWWKPEIRKKGRIALVRVHDEKSRSFTCLQSVTPKT